MGTTTAHILHIQKNSRKQPPDPTHRRQHGQIYGNIIFPAQFTRRTRRIVATTRRQTGPKGGQTQTRALPDGGWSSRPESGSNWVHFWPNPVQPARAFPSKGSPLIQPGGGDSSGATSIFCKTYCDLQPFSSPIRLATGIQE